MSVKTAARVAHTFHLDPVMLLEETDDLRWLVRVAAHNVIVQDSKDAQAKQQSHRSAVGGSPRRRGR